MEYNGLPMPAEEKIRFLEQCLDNKEKVNKSLREENRKRKEKLSEISMIADDEKQSIEHILELEEENRKLKEELDKFNKGVKASTIIIGRQGEEIRKLKNSIAYRKKKADKNQEKANQIDKIMKLPGVMRDGKINRISVARYYLI